MTNLVETKNIGDYIIEVSLNRPEKLNALTKPMWKKLGAIFKDFPRFFHRYIKTVIIRQTAAIQCFVIQNA